jgi:hypothetical protein
MNKLKNEMSIRRSCFLIAAACLMQIFVFAQTAEIASTSTRVKQSSFTDFNWKLYDSKRNEKNVQQLNWIPFNWIGDSVSGRYFDKLAITVPVTVDKLPHQFEMQLDLGAVTTVFYGNAIEPYLEKYSELKSKIDTTLTFPMQGQINSTFKNVDFKLGNVSYGKTNIGYFKNFGDSISIDSANSPSVKHIGTIAPDIFQDKLLIIDYPNKRICVADELPKTYSKAFFMPYKIREGRIKIPFIIGDKEKDLLFDTGSSLFALMTTEKRALQISGNQISDSLKGSNWGESFWFYGRKTNVPIKFGHKQLKPALVFYDRLNKFDKFYDEENIWGITGNAYFLNNVIIIDYKNKRFGVK